MNSSRAYKRQSRIITPKELAFPIAVIGAGGIGSWATLALAKMGCSNIAVYDNDIVEEHNLPSQCFSLSSVGMKKVDALQQLIQEMTGVDIHAYPQPFQTYTTTPDVIICAVDSLEQRREIWNILKRPIAPWKLLIDVRMHHNDIRVLLASRGAPFSLDQYERTLDPSRPVDPGKCTERSVIYNTFVCGGMIANFVKKFAKHERVSLSYTIDLATVSIYHA